MAEKVVVFRFSAMGDVALTLATFATVLKENPSVEITIVTRKKFEAFFNNQPRIKVIIADLEQEHKGISGLFKLHQSLDALDFEKILDLHQNLRTLILKFFFLLKGKKSYTIKKGRKEKKQLISGEIFRQLKHTCERYLDVFKESGVISKDTKIQNLTPFFKHQESSIKTIAKFLEKLSGNKIIGLAPFAQHIGKQWSTEKYEKLISEINQCYPETKILVFGGGKVEKISVESLAKKVNIINLIGKFSLAEELALIEKLDLFISGDSSNMHFAWMSGVPTLSIWGVTHHFTGFGPLFQNPNNIIEISKEILPYRPCSVYGKTNNQECIHQSMDLITVEMVMLRVREYLN